MKEIQFPVPLSDSQYGVYLDERNEDCTTKYNIPLFRKYSIEEIDIEKLSKAIKDTLGNFETSHYYFLESNDGVLMYKEANILIEVPYLETYEKDIDREMDAFIQPFDLKKAPLCRSKIIRTEKYVYLLLDFHHIISDGTSVNLAFDLIENAYFEKERANCSMSLAEHNVLLESDSYLKESEKDETYFMNKLDGISVDSNIPSDFPDNIATSSCSTFKADLKAPYGELESLAKKDKVTKGNLLIAAFAYALSVFTAQSESLFCTVCNGRDIDTQNSQGMFVRTFPYYQKFDETADIEKVFLDAKKEMISDVSHSKASFVKIATTLGLTTDILFTYQGRLYQKSENIKHKDAQSNIAFYVFNRENHFDVEVEYRSSLYKESTIKRLVDTYDNILKGFISEKTLSTINLIGKEDLKSIENFNKTSFDYDQNQNVVSLFKKQVKEKVNNIAVVYKDKKLTYKEIDDLSDKIASYLLKENIKKGDFVSILLSRSEWMPITSLGVLKAGAAYQPLDSTYPKERLSFMVNDASSKLLIADRSLFPLLPGYKGKVLFIDEIENLSKSPINVKISGEDSFIILYTSGTTGTPKGVMLKHSNILNHVMWQKHFLQYDSKSKHAAYASFGFDANMMDTYPVLTSGGELHIIDESIRLDLVALDEYFKKNQITHAFMTTQVGRQFATFLTSKYLKYLLVGGEKLVPITPPKNLNFYNIYGPTECSVYNTYYKVTSDSKLLPIGKAVGNTKLYVVDKFLRPLPIGASGELLIGGKGVGKGYLNRDDATSKAFIKNPFSTEKDYGLVYKSGDIVRYLEDGNIEFIGRKDGQVKIRGFRIELTEVEKVIRDYPDIKDCTVAAFDSPSGGKFIAAYIVSEKTISIDSLNAFIYERKPPYMVPEVTMQIDSIPLNQNSKVNKRALPKPIIKIEGNSLPLTDLEKEISSIIKDIIGTEITNTTALLSKYGLTSISSIRLGATLFKKYGIEFPNRELISNGSIKSIEDKILSKRNAESSITKKENIHSSRLTFSQLGVYTECVKKPESTEYNIPFEIVFPKGIDEKSLQNSIKNVVSNHPSIQVSFINDGEDVLMKECENFVYEIKSLKLSKEEYASYKKDFVKPFKLEGPLMRFAINDVSGVLHLLMDFHHLIMDGSSIDLFISELANSLDGKECEKEEYTYFDYAKDQKIDPADEEFFNSNMVTEEATRLIPDIYDKSLSSKEENVSATTSLKIVNEFARKNHLTAASIYLAATYIAASRFVYEDGVGIATISSGRSNPRIQNTMGMFVNTLPLTLKINSSIGTLPFLKDVANHFSETISHENYPFAKTAAKFDFHPSISYAYQVGVINEYTTKYGRLEVNSIPLNVAKIPVSVFINEGQNKEGEIDIAYDSSLYSEKMMRHFAKSIANAAIGLIEKEKIADISLVDEEDSKELDSYNFPWDLAYDPNDTAVSLFKKKAKEHPTKLAAVYKEKKYTYEQLDTLTDDLAKVIHKHLLESEPKSDEPIIAILSSRNENTFILPLAALKAGVSYEPLDPSYPQKRLNFMVKDANISLLLAEDSLREILNEYDGPIIFFSDLWKEEIPDIALPEVKPANRFIMLYTSGSTGLPKGVQLEHRNLVAYAYGSAKDNYYASNCVTAAYASFGFDVNMADTFCTLLNGGTLHLIPEEMRMNLDELALYFDENGITQCLLTTQVGVQFVQNHPKMKTLRYLTLGGEKLPSLDPSKLNYTLNNGYGPTENCCGVSLFPVKRWESNIPIGKPMKTIHAYILDKTNHRLPAGAAGEYCLSGPQVSRGYLNQEEKTKIAYEDCPYNEWRMYHTGDVVRYREDGNVEFVGRKDGQVKIRGFRIETKEIESTIREYKGIKDVTVQAYSYPSGGKYLAAFVVFDGELNISDLNNFIKAKLPSYMVPTITMPIAKIPLTVNQKVDKKALPEPKIESKNYIAPSNKIEEDFAEIFGKILGIDKVSADSDFFELGGSSINAMKVVIAANKKGYPIVYKDVFDHGELSSLASYAASLGKKVETSSTVKIEGKEANSRLGDGTSEIGPDGYDYSSINDLLSKNTLEAFKNNPKEELKDVLLIGATGFLGSHVFAELLKDRSRKVYCLLRQKEGTSTLERFLKIIHYYHGVALDEQIKNQVIIIEGDATSKEALKDFDVDGLTVINCAASVKHFAKDNEIEKTNVDTVINLIDYCLKHDSRLVHVSTESVMGNSKNGMPRDGFKFTENILYAGQEIESNQYMHSKFMAEVKIYEAILNQGLNAKVIRVGNLSPRYKDGTFQNNYASNSFMKSLSAYLSLGKIPYAVLDALAEFSPIDKVAESILLLSTTPNDCICFMSSNNHFIHIGDVLKTLSRTNPLKMVENEEFASSLANALNNPELSEKVSTLLVYQNSDKDSNLKTLGVESINNELTIQILYRLGFSYPTTDDSYIESFASKLREVGFFPKE